MSEFFPVYIYALLAAFVTLLVTLFTALISPKKGGVDKYMPYESGIRTETSLLEARTPMRHYLVALIFLVLDVEVVFMFPWAVVAKSIGSFAFYEMIFFLIALLVGFSYVWKKGGLEWE